MSTNTDPSFVHNGFFEILFIEAFNLIYVLEWGWWVGEWGWGGGGCAVV